MGKSSFDKGYHKMSDSQAQFHMVNSEVNDDREDIFGASRHKGIGKKKKNKAQVMISPGTLKTL